MNSSSKTILIVGMVASFVVASMLNVYPLKYTFGIRPMFLVMVLAFYVSFKHDVGLGGVFGGIKLRFVIRNTSGASGVLCGCNGICAAIYAVIY